MIREKYLTSNFPYDKDNSNSKYIIDFKKLEGRLEGILDKDMFSRELIW